jgi:2-phosphosulfolactate phosphatase
MDSYDINIEWGINGINTLAANSDVILIVDVLSFSTSVDIATANGAIVYPYEWKNESAVTYAESLGAELAFFERTAQNGFSLSPQSLVGIKSGTRLVLPSPNGSRLSLSTSDTPTICACLRNAKAAAEYAGSFGRKISIIPAGEQWPDNSLRPAFEDWIGAGAGLSCLHGTFSPEAKLAVSAFKYVEENLLENLNNCFSGLELVERGFAKDVALAAALNISNNVPLLKDRAYSKLN